jgi:hypothetical protein
MGETAAAYITSTPCTETITAAYSQNLDMDEI